MVQNKENVNWERSFKTKDNIDTAVEQSYLTWRCWCEVQETHPSTPLNDPGSDVVNYKVNHPLHNAADDRNVVHLWLYGLSTKHNAHIKKWKQKLYIHFVCFETYHFTYCICELHSKVNNQCHQCTSVNQFKVALKTHLFIDYFS